MDFQPQMKFTHPTGVPIPFFMAYPAYLAVWQQKTSGERSMCRDFEYLRQTYPAKVRKYQRRVEEIMDKLDYEGSVIYDEYPDRIMLECMGRTVLATLEREGDEEVGKEPDSALQGLVQVLVCNEIYRRRQKTRKYDG